MNICISTAALMRPIVALNSRAFGLCLVTCLLVGTPALAQVLPQQFQLCIAVEAGSADRQDKPIDATVDLTPFFADVSGTLDLQSLQVVEVDFTGAVVDESVLFQFDPDPDFDPALNASGNLVFMMGAGTPAGTTRYFQLAFDLEGFCPDCPAPPAVPNAVSVDSLT